MTEVERVLTQRVAQLEIVLEKFIPMADENFEILQESIALRSIENAVLRRILADVEGCSLTVFGTTRRQDAEVYRTSDRHIDFERYEAEYYGVQGFAGFVEAHVAWEAANPASQFEEPVADFVFGD